MTDCHLQKEEAEAKEKEKEASLLAVASRIPLLTMSTEGGSRGKEEAGGGRGAQKR